MYYWMLKGFANILCVQCQLLHSRFVWSYYCLGKYSEGPVLTTQKQFSVIVLTIPLLIMKHILRCYKVCNKDVLVIKPSQLSFRTSVAHLVKNSGCATESGSLSKLISCQFSCHSAQGRLQHFGLSESLCGGHYGDFRQNKSDLPDDFSSKVSPQQYNAIVYIHGGDEI